MSIFSGFGARSGERAARRVYERKRRRSELRGYNYAKELYDLSPNLYGTFEAFWDGSGQDAYYHRDEPEWYRIGARRFYMELEDKQAT